MIGHANWIGRIAALTVGLTMAACGTSSATAPESATAIAAEAGMESPAPVSWTPSEVFGTDGIPQVVVGPTRMMALWESSIFFQGRIRAKGRAHGGTWGPTRVLGRGYGVVASGNETGLTVAAWARQRDGGYRVMTSQRPPGGAWKRPQTIRTLPGRRDPIDIEVDVADNGAVVVSWVERVEQMDPPDPCWAYVARSTPKGVWRRPKLLVDRTWDYPQTSSAVSASGRMAVVYLRRSGLMYRERPRGGTWTPERQISRGWAADPHLMISGAGDTVVVAWTSNKALRAVRKSGDTWASPVLWAKPGDTWSFDAEMDAAGDVTFGWIGPQYSVGARSWPAGESLAQPQELLPAVDPDSFAYREEPQVAVGPDGHALVAISNHAEVDSIDTFVRLPGGDWRTDRLPRPVSQYGYEVAAGTGGRFAAAWARRGLRLSTLTLE